MKNKICIIIFLILLISACARPKDFPKNAKLCGNSWVSCVAVKKGMYHCKVYTRWGKKLLVDKNYIYPFFYQGINDPDLSGKVTIFDGDAIYFDGNRKLLATDMPDDAVCIQSLKEGVWVSVRANKGRKNHFTCIIYDIKGASTISSGEYVLKRFYWDGSAGRTRYLDVKEKVNGLELVYYGGVGISVRNKMVLLPYGWVDYPEPKGMRGGLRILYDDQANVIRQEEY